MGDTQIADVRAAADGAVNNLPVHGVYVTYTKPLLGQDVAGFFVQATQAGPAIFVAVDPASLATPPKAGDLIDFEATMVATQTGLKEITGVANLVIVSSGNDISALVTDVSSATDLVTNLGMYESRAIRIAGSFADDFTTAGAPQVATAIATTGLTDTNLKLRMPEAIRAQYGLGAGCSATADYGVMWRFNATAQPSVYDPASLTNMTCPAPTVVDALPTSSTEVVIHFTRPLDPATVQPTDFTFDGGLTAQAVSVNGTDVTVTLATSTTGGQMYTVTVATVNDTLGAAIGMPNNAIFKGYVPVAKMLFNEINPNISSSRDLIELVVIAPGSTNGVTLLQKSGSTATTLATLPDVTVAAGDIIVIHLNPTSANGNAPTSETTAKNEYANTTYKANFDGAWDFLGGTTGLVNSNRVLELDAPGGTVVDAVPFALTGQTPMAFPADLQALQAAGLWLPADCGGMPCTYTSNPTAVVISVLYDNVGSTPAGDSISRKPNMNTKQKSDWNAAGVPSWGAPNP
jgi:hypothetical protein